jgi:S-adenosylmethionine hydrolase
MGPGGEGFSFPAADARRGGGLHRLLPGAAALARRTFHGRDLFGPVTAHLALGVPLTEVGSPCDGIQTLSFPLIQRTTDPDGHVVTALGEVVHVDRFGNLIANLSAADLPPDPIFQVTGRSIVGLAPHFQPTGGVTDGLIALIGSAGLLEIAVPNGSAAALLGLGVGTTVQVRAAVSRSPARP